MERLHHDVNDNEPHRRFVPWPRFDLRPPLAGK